MNEDVHSLLAPYAVGALDDAEREAFERHLEACADCRADVVSFGEVTASLAEAETIAPPLDLRARVMRDIARTPQLPPVVSADGSDMPDAGAGDDAGAQFPARRGEGPPLAPLGRQGHPSALDSKPSSDVTPLRPRGDDVAQGSGSDDAREPAHTHRPGARRHRGFLVAAASIVAMAAVGLGWGLSRDDAGDALAMEREVMMIASAPDAHSMDLDLGATHIVVSDRMDAFAVMGTAAPMPAKGMEYQLWLVLEDGTKVAGPTFMPDDDGEVMTMMHADMAGAMAIGVTVEPAGGSVAPTSDVIAEAAL